MGKGPNSWSNLTPEQREQRSAELRLRQAEYWTLERRAEARAKAQAFWTDEQRAAAKAKASEYWTDERKIEARRKAIKRNGGEYKPWTIEPGAKFGDLEVVAEYDPSFADNPYDAKWICVCRATHNGVECLTLAVVTAKALLDKHGTRSCGCRFLRSCERQLARYNGRIAHFWEVKRPLAMARHMDAQAVLRARGISI